jgi:putative hydrolase of the HAD superfamily
MNRVVSTKVLPLARFEPDLLGKFGHVSTWVFDLDNTLYPADCGLWPQINQRVTLYLAALTGLDAISARALQHYYYHRHGTTLRGLVDEAAIDPKPFLDFVHDIDRSGLARDSRLAREIGRLPGRRLIFTNGSRDHALRTVAALGLDGLFEDAFDIVASGLTPKPAAPAYDAFFDRYGVDPAGAAMFEDIAKNLRTPKARGMTTVLIAPRAGQRDERDAADGEGRDAAYVDFVTDDLSGFLAEINDRLAASRARRLAAE